MQLLSSIVLFLGCTSALPSSDTYYVHEKRQHVFQRIAKREILDKQLILPVRIALTQSNLDKGSGWLDEVSSPNSDKYGQHWSDDQIKEAFAPSISTKNVVQTWLVGSGIAGQRIRESSDSGFLDFDASIEEVEELLKTQYHIYTGPNGVQYAGCDSYSLPRALQHHVDFVMPTIQSSGRLAKRKSARNEKRQDSDGSEAAITPTTCDKQITPDCVRQLYNFSAPTTKLVSNPIGCPEPYGHYLPSDLDVFFKNYSRVQIGNRPIFASIDGATILPANDSTSIDEGSLDIQYLMSLTYPLNSTFFGTGDNEVGGDLDLFLNGIDASYCTYAGGDNNTAYPDNQPGGYDKPEQCGVYQSTKVLSVSYGFVEFGTAPSYQIRQCNEYMKLGLKGISVVCASGDFGVGGTFGLSDNPECENPDGNGFVVSGGRFAPFFPASCPFVTAVGGLQITPGTNITKAIANGQQPEMVANLPDEFFVSGGGFSDVFPIQSYQNATVLSWFKNHKPSYSSQIYNNSMKARGYPDVSADGTHFVIAENGSFTLISGTSASTPVFASILALINEERAKVNKSTVGFVNPVLYANPSAFLDVTVGDNAGCNTTGFSAVAGWDPVSGLGSPKYPALLKAFLALS